MDLAKKTKEFKTNFIKKFREIETEKRLKIESISLDYLMTICGCLISYIITIKTNLPIYLFIIPVCYIVTVMTCLFMPRNINVFYISGHIFKKGIFLKSILITFIFLIIYSLWFIPVLLILVLCYILILDCALLTNILRSESEEGENQKDDF